MTTIKVQDGIESEIAMRKYVKKYRVAELDFRASDSAHLVILVGEDGEGWRVRVDQMRDWQDLWRTGIIIDIPLIVQVNGDDRCMVPDLSLLGDHTPERIVFDFPLDMLRRHWGADAVLRHMPSDGRETPPPPMDDPTPAPPKARKRRSPKAEAPKPGPPNDEAT